MCTCLRGDLNLSPWNPCGSASHNLVDRLLSVYHGSGAWTSLRRSKSRTRTSNTKVCFERLRTSYITELLRCRRGRLLEESTSRNSPASLLAWSMEGLGETGEQTGEETLGRVESCENYSLHGGGHGAQVSASSDLCIPKSGH